VVDVVDLNGMRAITCKTGTRRQEALAELRGHAQAARWRPSDPLEELVQLIGLSRRTVCYLLRVWQLVDDLGIPRDRLVHVGLDQDGGARRALRAAGSG
jgi:hypothetical protein